MNFLPSSKEAEKKKTGNKSKSHKFQGNLFIFNFKQEGIAFHVRLTLSDRLKKREEGRGKREEGRGKREEGRGRREEGRGKREMERWRR